MAYSIGEMERYFFHEGTNAYAYRSLGCHLVKSGRWRKHRFAVWAPAAQKVSVVGDFNGWNTDAQPMNHIDDQGLWETLVPELPEGSAYKYALLTQEGTWRYKADPYAFLSEERPGTASKICNLAGYAWGDDAWMKRRKSSTPYDQPVSIYEMHLGSWREAPTYRNIATELVPYLLDMGYTHVEFMPLAEHPLDASWGYQVTGYFAATNRYGTPQDLMYLIDQLHQNGIGVIMDWVPAHFPKDDYALRLFDGTPCYEHPNPLRSELPEWGTLMFDYERPEVVSFLLSSALFWLDVFHVDGLRADAVTTMLYLDFAGKDYLPNAYGGTENLGAVAFLRKCSEIIFRDFPGVLFCAEESTSYPQVTHPVYQGGLGFNFKWNMGWMHDMLDYISMDPFFRSYHHDKLTFSMFYAFSENYILPLSHDEVVHGKKSLIGRMPGDIDAQFANMRVFFAYMFVHPGKKLMFMGAEFGQFIEWRFYEPLEWKLLLYQRHPDLKAFVKDLNHFYRAHPSLYQVENSWDGFSWLNVADQKQSVISLMRISEDHRELLVCVFNFTPVAHEDYRLGLPMEGYFKEALSTDSPKYGGSGEWKNPRTLRSQEQEADGKPYSIGIKLPPYGGLYFSYTPFPPLETARNKVKRRRTALRGEEAALKEIQAQLKALPPEEARNPREDMLYAQGQAGLETAKAAVAEAKARLDRAADKLAALEALEAKSKANAVKKPHKRTRKETD